MEQIQQRSNKYHYCKRSIFDYLVEVIICIVYFGIFIPRTAADESVVGNIYLWVFTIFAVLYLISFKIPFFNKIELTLFRRQERKVKKRYNHLGRFLVAGSYVVATVIPMLL